MGRSGERRLARRTAACWPATRIVALAAVLWVSAAVPATASSDTAVSVWSGSLAVTAPAVNDFALVTLDGTAQVAHAPLEQFSVTDARGSGRGWTLTLQATPFREWDGTGYVSGGKGLPAGSLGLDGLTVVAHGTDSRPPVVSPGPYRLDGPAVTVATAPAGTGMGTFVFEATTSLAVAVPAHAFARTYRSELAISVTSGP